MKARWLLPPLIALLALASYLLWPRPPAAEPGFSLQGLLGGETTGYARAEGPRSFRFPADHGPHPDYRSEWWYLTGNLDTADGRRLGFQFTVFRFALAPRRRGGTSAWATRQAYMAHLTLTDPENRRFYAHERFSRGAIGLAGARARPFRVWLEDWELAASGDPWPWQLRAATEDIGLNLRLIATKPPVLQGRQGLSRKGPAPGNASYYYSYSRLRAEGSVTVAGRRARVTGSAWLDREWSSSALPPELAGWDWFALQFADGSELMLYRLRRTNGEASPFSAASYVPAEGAVRHLDAEQFRLRATEHWRSPETGVAYPTRWQLRIPSLDAALQVTAALPGQELDLAVRYWEGAVDVRGELRGQTARGRGYMELTGYRGGESSRAR